VVVVVESCLLVVVLAGEADVIDRAGVDVDPGPAEGLVFPLPHHGVGFIHQHLRRAQGIVEIKKHPVPFTVHHGQQVPAMIQVLDPDLPLGIDP